MNDGHGISEAYMDASFPHRDYIESEHTDKLGGTMREEMVCEK